MRKLKFFIFLNLICAANINANIFNRLVGHVKFVGASVRLVRLVNREKYVIAARNQWRLIDPTGKYKNEFGQSILGILEKQAIDLDHEVNFEFNKLEELDKMRKGKKGN